MLAKAITQDNQRDWDLRLCFVMAAYRAAKHESTGYSPNFLIFEREARALIDLVLGPPPVDEETFSSADEFVAQMQRMQRESYALARATLALLSSGVKMHTTSRPSQPDLKLANGCSISTQGDTLGDHQSETNVTKGLTSSREQYHHVSSSSRELEEGNHSSSTAINSSPTTAKHPHTGCQKAEQNSQRGWFPTLLLLVNLQDLSSIP